MSISSISPTPPRCTRRMRSCACGRASTCYAKSRSRSTALQADRMIECARSQGQIPDGSDVDPISAGDDGRAAAHRARYTRARPAHRRRRRIRPGRVTPAYLLQRSLGGGALLDAGVYFVSIVSGLLGAPLASEGVRHHRFERRRRAGPLDNRACGRCSGRLLRLAALSTRSRFEIMGDRGLIRRACAGVLPDPSDPLTPRSARRDAASPDQQRRLWLSSARGSALPAHGAGQSPR